MRPSRCASFRILGFVVTLLALAVAPAGALGPSNPPVIKGAYVWVENAALGPQLMAQVDVELPGGIVPLHMNAVEVDVPGGSVHYIPLDKRDLSPETGYQVNLTSLGVVGFPAGTYTFHALDTAGGHSMATDVLGSTSGLPAISSMSITGLVPVPAANGTVNLLDIGGTPNPVVSWSAVAGAATYQVRIRGGYQDFNYVARNTTGTSLAIPSGVLLPGRRYVVRVEAYDQANGFGCSPSPCTSADLNARTRRDIELITSGPEVFLQFPNATPYTAGSTLNIATRIYNPATPVTVDIHVWIGFPGGSIVVGHYPGVIIPANPNADFVNNNPLFSHTFTGGEPSGSYVAGIRLTDPTTGDTVAVATRTFVK